MNGEQMDWVYAVCFVAMLVFFTVLALLAGGCAHTPTSQSDRPMGIDKVLVDRHRAARR